METRCCSPPEAARVVVVAVFQAHGGEQLVGALAGGPGLDAVEHEGQLDVLGGGQVGDEVASRLLPDEADGAAAVAHHLGLGHGQQVASADEGAAGARLVEPGEDVEQGALARAGSADDGHQLAPAHLQVEPAQGDHLELVALVNLEQILADDVRGGVGFGAGESGHGVS